MQIIFEDKYRIAAALIATITTSLASPIASANMMVYPMGTSIGAGSGPAAELRVYSKSESTQYVKVIAKRVIDPATDHEREETSMSSGDDAVVISPAKFALPAGGTRLVRVISLGVPQKEALYRVYMEPVASLSEDHSAVNDEVSGKVNFTISWAPLVRVLPKTPVPDFEVSNGLLTNTGNVRIGLIDAGACQTDTEDSSCQWTKFERSVYPDQQFRMDGLNSAPYVRIRYRVEGMSGVQQKVVRTVSTDAIDALSANNETQTGPTNLSTNHKD